MSGRQILTINTVHPNPETRTMEHGTFKRFVVTVKSEAGNTRDAVWNRKVKQDGSFTEPRVGDRIEAEPTQIKEPPGWWLQNPKLVRDDGTTWSPSPNSGGGGEWSPEKTADVHRQVALKAAGTLFGPMLGTVDPMTSSPEWWNKFWGLYEGAVDRLARLLDTPPQQYGQQQGLPEARRDFERTGESDIPTNQQDFDQPAATPVPDEDPVPFLREPERSYEDIKVHASRW